MECENQSDFVLDLDDAAFIHDPYPTYQWLRDNAPVYAWPGHFGHVFTRYRDVRAIYNDRRISNDLRLWEHAPPEVWPEEYADYKRLIDHGLFRLGHDDHVRVRKLVSGALTPRAVERMRDAVQDITDRAIEQTLEGTTMDIRALAEAIPLGVVSDILKIPLEFQAEFRAFAVASVESTYLFAQPEAMFAVLAPMPGWLATLRHIVRERRNHPEEGDLLSSLLVARDQEARLSEDELVSLVHALITAGTDTTVHALCFAVLSLLKHPAAIAELRADPSLVRNAVEESLRYDMFGKGGIPKICTEDLEISGRPFRKGQMVYPFVPAALHDPEVFPEPETFDIHRDLSRTIAFGGGKHFCLGAALARLELEIAVETLLRRFATLELQAPPAFEPNPVMRSMKSLWVHGASA